MSILLIVTVFQCSSNENNIDQLIKTYKGKYVIIVDKSEFSLKVIDKRNKVIKDYKIGYGQNPDKKAKLYSGDNRTPEGTYYINKILSIDADKKSTSYKELRAINDVYFSAREGHAKYGKPDVDLGKNVYGPRYYGLNYPNKRDRLLYDTAKKNGLIPKYKNQFYSIGSGIAIHGNSDPESIGHLVSNGCVRMFNSDLIELEQYIQIGTPVIIKK